MAKRDEKKSLTKDEVQLALIDNFINLQKVMADLSVKFDELTINLNSLLKIFEASAKTFAERYSTDGAEISGSSMNQEIADKINQLFEQNKIISKGIMLIEEKLRTKDNNSPNPMLPSMQQTASPSYSREIGARQDQKNSKPLPRY